MLKLVIYERSKGPYKQDSMFYHSGRIIAEIIDGEKILFILKCVGEISLQFEENGMYYKNENATEELLDRNFDDEKVKEIYSNALVGNNNWFEIEENNNDNEFDVEVHHEYNDAMSQMFVLLQESNF